MTGGDFKARRMGEAACLPLVPCTRRFRPLQAVLGQAPALKIADADLNYRAGEIPGKDRRPPGDRSAHRTDVRPQDAATPT